MLKEKIFHELQLSLLELEKSVLLARQSLTTQKDLPSWVFARLDQYMKIIDKQKTLANQIVEATSFETICSIANKINVLSGLIADDSVELINSILKPGENKFERKNYISC
ncbi:MAG: hypothetical protein NZT61_00965 [Deltaproteobacteria bacterium]|nr:hypothetical protein [Deltaproteobacteria bacterium]